MDVSILIPCLFLSFLIYCLLKPATIITDSFLEEIFNKIKQKNFGRGTDGKFAKLSE